MIKLLLSYLPYLQLSRILHLEAKVLNLIATLFIEFMKTNCTSQLPLLIKSLMNLTRFSISFITISLTKLHSHLSDIKECPLNDCGMLTLAPGSLQPKLGKQSKENRGSQILTRKQWNQRIE